MHSMAIYAVLTGINAYPLRPLSGCLSDVQAVEEYLYHFKEHTGTELFIRKLTDDTEPATRETLIAGFGFFASAGPGDFCLFYYSGHGSYAAAPPQFRTGKDGYNESFVCIDSRTPGGRDLVDKEMSYLIWKTFKNKPDTTVVVITDCCHSGTITKGLLDDAVVTDRMQSPDLRPVSVSDYYGFGETVDGQSGYLVSADAGRITVLQAEHIHLAASGDRQTSRELKIEGVVRGVFTYALLKTLYATGGLVSYKDLVEKAGVVVKNIVGDQQPRININGGLPRTVQNNMFLSHSSSGSNPLYQVYYDPAFQSWCVNAGQLQGVAKGDTVYIEQAGITVISRIAGPAVAAISPLPQLTDRTGTYRAGIRRLSVRPLLVSFAPDADSMIKNSIQHAATANSSSFYLLAADTPGRYIVHTAEAEAFISLPGSDKPVFKPLPVGDMSEAVYFLEKLEIVSRWKYLQELVNTAPGLDAKQYTLTLFHDIKAGDYTQHSLKEITLQPVNDFFYKQAGDGWYQPAMRLRFINNSPQTLWFACAYMGFDFSIAGDYFEVIQAGAGQTAWLSFNDAGLMTDVVKLRIDVDLQELGYSEITEYIKIFISTAEIDISSLRQDGIEMPVYIAKNIIAKKEKGIGTEISRSSPGTQWKTELIGLRITKPLESTAIVPGTETILNGLTILAHTTLDAQISFTSSAHTARSADKVTAPHLVRQNACLMPYDLSPDVRSDAVMDVLELMNVSNPDAVHAEAPLVIRPAATRSAALREENIIPVGYDELSGVYVALGYTDHKGHVVINALPASSDTDAAVTQRSLLGSIKIYFQKVVGQKLGFTYNYPRLAVATVADGKVHYEADRVKVATAVSGATNIALFIHGIIGDTEGMVKCIDTVMNDGRTLRQCFDLVLCFDYENLNTHIEQTAHDLHKKLTEAGFAANDGRQLTLVAHSMGGLVSRWFVEKLGGNKLADRLIMLGTPNNGSPWADVRDLMAALLTFAINGAAFLKPWTFLLSGLGRLVQGLQVTLKQMDAESGIYTVLNDGTLPGIPYTIIAGNTRAIIPHYGDTTSALVRLFARMKTRAAYDALDLVLFRKPNDIAVADESITAIKGSESWMPARPVLYEVASDHLNYFITPEALCGICIAGTQGGLVKG